MAKNTVIVSITSNIKGLQKGLKDSQSALGKVGKGLRTVTKIGAGAAVAVAAVGAALGWKRLKDLDSARTKMLALGVVGKEQKAVMDAVGNSVRGTAFGLADMADVSTLALGAGIRDSNRLNGSLKAVANAAALGRSSVGEMGLVFNKTWARGTVTMNEINQLNTRGIAIQGMLQKTLGVTADELNKMISSGQVTAEDLEAAFLAAGDAAKVMGDDISGRASNALSALGRLGASALLPFFDHVKTGMGEVLVFLWGIEDRLAPIFTAWNDKISAAFNLEGAGERLLAGIDKITGKLGGLFDKTKPFDFSALISGLVTALERGISQAATWISGGGLRPIFDKIVAGRTAMINAGLALFTAIGDALPEILPALLQALLAFVTQMVQLIVDSAPVILDAGVQIFTGLVASLAVVLPVLLADLLGMLPDLVTAILTMVPAILDAATTVFTSLVDALPVILPPLVSAIVDLLPEIVEATLSMLPRILDAAVQLFTALVNSLPVILPLLVRAIYNLLPSIVSSVVSMLPQLLAAAIDLFMSLALAVPQILPDLISALVGLFPVIVSTVLKIVPQLIKAGGDIIGGLVTGFMRSAGKVGEALLNIAKKAVGNFLSFLGINSPSKLFAGFGDNTIDGLVVGFRRSASSVDKEIDALSRRVTDGFDPELTAPNLSFAGTGSGRSGNGGRVYNITVQTLNPSAETGRVIVQSIEDYERAGGRL